MWEWLKQLIGKAVTLGGTAAIYAGVTYFAGHPAGIEWKALLLVAAYAFWSQGIAPAIEGLFKEQGTAEEGIKGVTYLKLI